MNNLIFSILLISSFAFSGCAKSSDKTMKINDYIKELEKNTLVDTKMSIQKDTAVLNELISNLDDIAIRASFSIGLSFGGEKPELDDFVSENPFVLNVDVQKEKNYFKSFVQNAFFYQKYNTVAPSFSVYTTDRAQKRERDDLKLSNEIKKIYFKGQEVERTDVGLLPADSLLVESKINIPLSVETLDFTQKDGELINYKTKKIQIRQLKGKSFTLEVPAVLYPKILAYQALTSDGKLMNPVSKNERPIFCISEKLLDDLKKMSKQLDASLLATDKEEVLALLTQLTQEQLDARTLLTEYISLLNKEQERDLDIEAIQRLIVKGSNWGVLENRAQAISAEFPHPIERVRIYFGNEFEGLQQEHIVKLEAQNKEREFNIYTDEENLQGIVNPKGKIIIPAKYSLIADQGSGYFRLEDPEDWRKFPLAWLNIKSKRFEELSNGYSFEFSVDEKRAAFTDSLGNFGVMEGLDKIVLPFEYQSFYKLADYCLGEKTIEKAKDESDDTFDDKPETLITIFDDSFHPIITDLWKYWSLTYDSYDDFMKKAPEGNLFIVRSCSKYGFVNLRKPWSWVLPLEYDNITTSAKHSDYLQIEKTVEGKKRCGIVDTTGKVIIPDDYSELWELSRLYNDKAVFVAEREQKGKKTAGIIDIDGKIIVPFDYKEIATLPDNDELFVVVREKDGFDYYGLINIENKIIIPIEYAEITKLYFWPDNWLRVSKTVDGKQLKGAFDINGKTIVSPKYAMSLT